MNLEQAVGILTCVAALIALAWAWCIVRAGRDL